mgnify:FL=1
MTILLEELKERLTQIDEITLLETLEIDSTSLVETYEDKIIQEYDRLVNLL